MNERKCLLLTKDNTRDNYLKLIKAFVVARTVEVDVEIVQEMEIEMFRGSGMLFPKRHVEMA